MYGYVVLGKRKAKAYIFKATDLVDGATPQKIGYIEFIEAGDAVIVSGTLTGLSEGNHGFHVHQNGDLGDWCRNVGGHFNPTKQLHGGPKDAIRHVGDLGNIVSFGENEPDKKTHVNIRDHVIKLTGPYSIIGRGVVIHEKADDLGRSGAFSSKTTGNAGEMLACGVIAWVDEEASF
uniref:Superoxide dismutase copper/zinc binding domain-containing protein n=1 Tax=Plectus sambesii TaxID=2011161 RepID=A0A914WNY2_9BILA